MMESIEIPIKAVGKPRMVSSDKWKIPSGRASKSVYAYIAFADSLRLACRGFNLRDDVEIIFEFAPPQSWSKKKRLSCCGQPHQQKPDIDNLVKSIFDILRPGKDHLIWHITASKFWGNADKIVLTNKKGMP